MVALAGGPLPFQGPALRLDDYASSPEGSEGGARAVTSNEPRSSGARAGPEKGDEQNSGVAFCRKIDFVVENFH